MLYFEYHIPTVSDVTFPVLVYHLWLFMGHNMASGWRCQKLAADDWSLPHC